MNITENRQYQGISNMSIPMTLDGERKYVTSMTLTKAPQKISGKLNYLVPRLMKKFEYSFNFAAWKNIEDVDPESGEFQLEGLPFGEGQNVLAVRAVNAVSVSSHQILKIIVNTMPQFVGNPSPEANAHTNDVYQTISATASKAKFIDDLTERIRVTSFLVDGEEKLPNITVTSAEGTYTFEAKAEWIPQEALADGQHSVSIAFNSNVGVSHALWNFYVDTTAPTISIATLEAYSPRAPNDQNLNIKFTTADNLSQFLKNISIRVYQGTEPNEDTNFIAEIDQLDSQAVGEHFVNWDGKKADGEFVRDGIYTIRIKAFDNAGNWTAEAVQVNIDATSPDILETNISPLPFNSAEQTLGFVGKFSEPSSVILKLTRQSDGQISSFVTQSSELDSNGVATAAYNWTFDSAFVPNLEDGTYTLEVVAGDEAGNESSLTYPAPIIIDRTPPVIYSQMADPYVLANSGANAYSTTLRYQLSESNDAAENRQESGSIAVQIKLFNENTGDEVRSENVNGSLEDDNAFFWDASSASIAKGAYKFQITATDQSGNSSIAYATCVKDGIAPTISYPPENQSLAGTITIRGTAMDPDWTNSLKFKQYYVFYKKGVSPLPQGEGLGVRALESAEWKTELIEVPEIYRNPASAERNVSIRPVQNDATIAYFHGQSLSGVYTVLVIAEEEGGAKFASARTITIDNERLAALDNSANPVVSLHDLPEEITFNGSNSLPVGFDFGGKDLNAYLEIFKLNDSGTKETAYYKYFPDLSIDYYSGQPLYESGNEMGYFVWQDDNGWHVRWNGEQGQGHRFSGALVAAGEITDFSPIGSGIKQIATIVNWDRTMTGGEGGFDFKTSSTSLIITSSLDDDPATYEDDFESSVVPYFGLAKYQPAETPVILSGISEHPGITRQTISWEGKTESKAFVDSGNYLIRVRAEGADGKGLTQIEKQIKVTTPFILNNVQLSSSSFDPLGLPDRATVSYNISKDAHVKLKVYKPGMSEPLAVIDEGIQLGRTNVNFPLSISWRGNYPDKEGTQIATQGNYSLKLVATPTDGSPAIERDISPSVSLNNIGTSAQVILDPIGEEVLFNGQTIRAAEGSSQYLWEARAEGTYYPPLDYSYTLGLQGQQKAKIYPYVPFAGMLHRSFDKVDVKFKIYLNVSYYDRKKNWGL
ncbi:MAG: Ig-like domain repeat protein, partial [bacterium]